MGFFRSFLAISVISSHSGKIFGLSLLGGDLAVKLFFMISGFYMSLILRDKYSQPNHYWIFLTNRFLRIFPLYWAVLALTLLFGLIEVSHYQHSSLFQYYANHWTELHFFQYFVILVPNLILFGQDLLFFLGIHPETGNLFFSNGLKASHLELTKFLFLPQAWSLALELTFYLFAPTLVRKRTSFILSLIFASLFLRSVVFFGFHWTSDIWINRFLPFEILFFLAGILSHRLYSFLRSDQQNPNSLLKIPIQLYRKLNQASLSTKIIFLILGFGLFAFHFFSPKSFFSNIQTWTLYCFICLALPILFHLSENMKFDRLIGELSYPLYVVHLLILYVLQRDRIHFFGLDRFPGELTVVMSLLASYLLFKIMIQPIDQYRQRRASKVLKPT
jgi:peptidoglycan/LPS O-acetylase OafA/YrhL